MGGVKKKSMASMEKQQDSQDASQEQTPTTGKGKKTKEQKGAPSQKKQLSFLAPQLTDADLMKSLVPLKAITLHTAARALGVNAAVANGLLRGLEERKLVHKAGGFSGHTIWAADQKS